MKRTEKNKKAIMIFTCLAAALSIAFFFSQVSLAAISKTMNYQGRLSNTSDINVADGAYDMVFRIYTVAGGGSAAWTESWTAAALWTETGSTTITSGDGGNCPVGTKKIAYTTGTNEGSLAAGQLLWNTTIKESATIQSVAAASNYICAYNPVSAWSNGDDLTNRVYIKGGIFSASLGTVTPQSVDFTGGDYYLGVTVGTDSEMVPRKRMTSVPQAMNANNLVGDGRIGLSNTSPAADAASITYNPTSGANNALSVVYGGAGGTGTALNVVQAGSGFALRVNDDGTATDSTPFVIDANGNVGIGTASPAAALHVSAGAGQTWYDTYKVHSLITGDAPATLADIPRLIIGSHMPTVTGMSPGELFFTKNTSGSYKNYGAGIGGWSSSGTWRNLGLRLFTSDTTDTAPQTRMVITHDGNVGIGTTAPGALLSVGATNQFQVNTSGDIIKLKNLTYSWPSSHTTNGFLQDNGSGTLTWTTIAGAGGVSGTGTDNYIPRWNGTTALENSIIYDNGTNVGIGTASPNDKLQIGNTWDSVITGVGAFNGAGDASYIGFNAFETSTAGVWDTVNASYDGGLITVTTSNTDTLSKMRFGFVDQSSVAETTAMTILKDGNVGIGTESPGSYKLNVAGNTYLNGPLYIGGGDTPANANGRVTLPANGYIQGGAAGTNQSIVQFSAEAGSNAGYGIWTNYNAYWDGSNWKQPRGSLGSYLYTSNYHLGWSWRYAAAGSSDGGTITPAEVAKIDLSGNFTQKGSTLTLGNDNGYIVTPGSGILNLNPGGNTVNLQDGSNNFSLNVYSAATIGVHFAGSGSSYFNGGSVGIGTASPSFLLDVQGSTNGGWQTRIWNSHATAGYGLQVRAGNDATNKIAEFRDVNDNVKMTILGNGNVGIGTASPGAILQVHSATADSVARISNLASGTTAKLFIGYDNGASQQGLELYRTYGSSTTYINNNQGGSIVINPTAGNVGIGTTAPGALLSVGATNQFQVNTSGDIIKLKNLTYSWPSSHTTNGFLQDNGSGTLTWTTIAGAGGVSGTGIDNFIPRWNGTTALENSIIYDNGTNVGIGTSVPTGRLHIQGAASSDVLARIQTAASEYDSRLFLGEQSTYGMTFEYDGSANIGYLGMNNNVDPTGAWSKRIQMSRDGTEVAFMAGNVGIGTASPQTKFNIAGGSDVVLATANTGYMIIGNPAGTHIAFDDNEIMAKASGTTGATLSFQVEGGTTAFGGPITAGTYNSQTISSAASFTGTVGIATSVTAPNHLVTAVNGNGICFWGDCTNYTISMGDNQADFGSVTDYSMHFNMGASANRGFTWGSSKTAVIASLNALNGNFATSGTITASGAIAGTTLDTGQGANELYDMNQNVQTTDSPTFATAKLTSLTDGYIPYHVSDASGLANSNIYYNGTNVGIGTASPGSKLAISGSAGIYNNNNFTSINMYAPSIGVGGTNYYKGIQINSYDYNIATGITDNGYRVGLSVEGYISDAEFLGTLNSQYGIWARHGSYTGSAGAVNTSYGVYIQTLTSGTTTFGNLYGLYQDSSVAKNYFAGNVGIGTASPTAGKFQVAGGAAIAGYFTSTADAQINLNSSDAWAGIGFDDSGATNDYIWYNGANGTFAFGGGGSNVSGKKLHVDGGMTIGANYDATAMAANGLSVEGNIATAGDLTVSGGDIFAAANTDLKINDYDTNADSSMDVCLFGDCAISQANNYYNKLKLFGGGGQSRDLQIWQQYSEYAHIGSSWASNRLYIDSSFAEFRVNSANTYFNGAVALGDGDDIAINSNDWDITSAGVGLGFTSWTVDNVIIDGTTIGHTSDTDLLSLASGTLTVNGGVNLTGSLSLASGQNKTLKNYFKNDDTESFINIDDNMTIEEVAEAIGRGTTTTGMTKVDDPTAPAPGAFEVSGYQSVGPGASTPYWKVDQDSEYIFEVWVKVVSSTATPQRFYAGWEMYDSAKTTYGNVQRYWGSSGTEYDSNSYNDGEWHHVVARISGVGASTGNFIDGTEYARLVLLMNHSTGDTITRYAGMKLYKAKKVFASIYAKDGAVSTVDSDGKLIMDYNGNITPNNLQASGAGPHWFSSGKVGIGTTNPASGLVALSSSFAGPSLTHGTTQGLELGQANGYTLAMGQGGSSPYYYYMQVRHATADVSGVMALNPLGGNVGIGTTSPQSLLSVGASSQFQVNSSGDIIKLKNLTYSWPSSHATDGFLKNNGSGTLTWTTIAGAGGVTGTGTDNYIPRWNGTTALENSIIYDNGTNVGIGTASPGTSLQIGTSKGFNVYQSLPGAINPRWYLLGRFDDNNGELQVSGILAGHDFAQGKANVNVKFSKRGGMLTVGNVWGSVGTASNIVVYDDPGSTNNYVYLKADDYALVNIDLTAVSGALISYNGTYTETDPAGSYTLAYTLSTDAGSTIRQLTDGNVGIGTASPGEKLQVNGNMRLTADSSYLQFQNAAGNGRAYIQAHSNNGLDFSNQVADGPMNFTTAGAGDLKFFTNSFTSERMRITGTGNVGIGTASPAYPLQVSGGYAKTDTSPRLVAMFGSNEGAASFGAKINVIGAATVANSVVNIQTGDNSLNSGSLGLQAYGGNVGIGTTNPTLGKLQVVGNTYLNGNTTNTGYVSITGAQDASGNLRFSAANPYITASSYTIFSGGIYVSGGTLYTQNTFIPRAGIRDDEDEDTYFESRQGLGFNIDYDNNNADTEYFTWNKNGAGFGGGSELMRLTEGGNLGIGMTSPREKLEVNGNIALSSSISTIYNPFSSGSIYINPGFFCFAAGTKISLGDGSLKNIEDIEVGDEVVAYDVEKKQKTNSQVTKTFQHRADEMDTYYLHIRTVGGQELKITREHPIFVDNQGWEKAENAKVGDGLLNQDGERDQIVSIERDYEPISTYNIEVDQYHDYFAEGILVHNKGNPGNLILVSQAPDMWNPTSNVGIGTTSPAAFLDVNGTAWLRGNTGYDYGLYVDDGGSVGIGTTNPSGLLEIAGDMTMNSPFSYPGSGVGIHLETVGVADAYFGLYSGRHNSSLNSVELLLENSNHFLINGGNVGIGTTNPVQKLDVAGTVRMTGITGSSQTISNSYGNYLHLGGWAVARTAATAVLVNTAYMADIFSTARTINSVSFNGSANITVEPYIEDDESTAAARYLTFTDTTTAGYKRLNEDSSLTYNPSTNVLTAGTFSGNLSGGTVSATTGTFSGVVAANAGISIDGNTVIDDGGGWHRSYGSTGWYNGTYAGGWYMTDATWIRSYNSKAVYMNGNGTTSAAFMSGNVGIGTSNPYNKLQVVGSIGLGTHPTDQVYRYVLEPESSNAYLAMGYKSSASGWYSNNPSLVMTYTGNVGIGTTNPGYKLEVYNSGAATTMIVGSPLTGKTFGYMSTSADTNGYVNIEAVKTSGSAFGNLVLNQNGGNVGIGTTNPSAKMHVLSANVAGKADAIVGTRYQVSSVNYSVPGTDGHFGIIGSASYNNVLANLPSNSLGSPRPNVGVLGIASGSGSTRIPIGVAGYAQAVTSTTGWVTGGQFNADTVGNLGSGETLSGVYAYSDGTKNTVGADTVYGSYSEAVGQGTDTVYGGYFTGTGGGTNYGVYSAAGINYFSGNVGIGTVSPGSYKLNVAGSTYLNGTVTTSGAILRSAAGAGYLNGQYASVETTNTSGAIYSIGGTYVPGTTTLGNMYGIGYGYSGGGGITFSGLPGSLWGMYAASAGVPSIFLSSGDGIVYASQAKLSGNLTSAKLITTGNNVASAADPSAADLVIGSTAGTRHDSSIMYWSNTSAIRQLATGNAFQYSVWGSLTPDAQIGTANSNSFFNAVGGNVGIGTTTPGAKLQVFSGGIAIGTSTSATEGARRSIQMTTDTNYGGTYNDHTGSLISSTMPGGWETSRLEIRHSTGWNTFASVPDMVIGANVGIGTTTPLAKLDVRPSASYPTFEALMFAQESDNPSIRLYRPTGASSSWPWRIQLGGGVSAANLEFMTGAGAAIGAESVTSKMTITNAGNLGIGTTNPGNLLDVNGQMRLVGGATSPGRVLKFDNSGDYTQLGITQGWISYLTNNAYYTGSQWNYVNTGGYGGVATQLTNSSGEFHFNTASNAANPVVFYDRMTILNNGNVGIGTPAPDGNLNVYRNTAGTGAMILLEEDGSGDAAIRYRVSDAFEWMAGVDNSDGDKFKISGSTTGLEANTRFTIDSSGRVGIGTTYPVAQLHVSQAASNLGPMLYGNGALPQFPRTLQNVSASITTNDATAATGAVVGLNLENSSQTNNTFSPLIAFSRKSASGGYNPNFAYIGGLATGNGGDTNWTAGDLTFGTANASVYGPVERMRITAGGNVGIGTTNPGNLKLVVVGTSVVTGSLGVGSAGAPNYTLNVVGTAWVTSGAWSGSDVRWKKDIQPIEGSLDKIMQLSGVSYDWRREEFPQNNFDDKTHLGFIAQDVEKISPELVTTGTDGYKGIDYNGLTPLLVNAIKEQQGMISEQESTIGTLDLKISENKSDVAELQTALNDKLSFISNALSSDYDRIGVAEGDIDGIKTRLAEAETKLLEQENNLVSFESGVNDTLSAMLETENMLTERVLDHEDRIKALEDKLATATITTDGEISVNALTEDTLGNVTLTGIFEAKEIQAETGSFKGILTAETVQAKDVVADNVETKEITSETANVTSAIVAGSVDTKELKLSNGETSGRGIIKAGETSVVIETIEVDKKSNVYITTYGDNFNMSPYYEGVVEEQSFTVKIKAPVAEDINFNWLIIK